ncbi:glutamine--fructose-6-phosphate transaminase (isomerizing) [Georgenia sp. Z1344]|uniref:glutamine--fructose-6-phosphate transaminase (isomerizing) n=1 Tax=Georgenia sp. Z1344 TaxID=3416706 RepID=UPI003CFA5470
MCGIVGYVGPSAPSTRPLEIAMDGLARLEYRGYDSAGIAVHTGEEIVVRKRAGKLQNLRDAIEQDPVPDGVASIGHTRWATHGGPTDANAHPHVGGDGAVAVIHNGIIENFAPLRRELVEAGVEMTSQTDTEVVAHLLAAAYDGDLTAAMLAVVGRLEGAFTILAQHRDQPGTVVGARRSSPLVVGLGEGENFLGSDVSAFISGTKEALELDEDQVVTITPGSVEVVGFDGSPAQGRRYTVDWDAAAAVKDGFPTFMDKEIHDQPAAVRDTLLGRRDEEGRLVLNEMRIEESVLRTVDKVIIIACGTAAYAGHVAKYAIEHWCRIPCEVELASEFRYRDPVVTERTLVVAISQSGETMDTLMAVRHAREQGSKVLAIVNTFGSTIAREADAVLYTHAGPEIAVASTKAFLAQITGCYLLGLYLSQLRGNKYPEEVAGYLEELAAMPDKIAEVLEKEEEHVRELARSMADTDSVLFLGRHVGFPVALEGALKLKELAYIHAEGFAAGELKHGPIALVDEGQPVFVVVPTPRRPVLHQKVVSNIQEVRARGALTIVVAEEGDTDVEEVAEHVIRVPRTPTLMMPLVTTVPLQIFASEVAAAKGLDVDQPRNLAKSVTVE